MVGPIDKTNNNQQDKSKNIPKVWGKGPVPIYDIKLDCYILEDGTAVLNKGKMMKALGRPWKGNIRSSGLPAFIGAVNLQPFIKPELREKLKGIEFYDGNKLKSGYHADILPLVCNVYLEAREAGVLLPSQRPTAQKSEILMRSFARVGIVALIYEQLHYEKYKNPNALKLLVESYLAEEVRAWAKEFPDELFIQMDRIYGNIRTTSRNRPKYYANFIRKYIYKPIESGYVLNKLDELNPINEKGTRKHRFHSFLNTEKGVQILKALIWQVVALLRISPAKAQFERAFARLTSNQLDMFDDSEFDKKSEKKKDE